MALRNLIAGSLTANVKSVVFAGGNYLRAFWGKNDGSSTIYIHVLDASALPSNGTVTHKIAPIEVAAGMHFQFEPPDDLLMRTGFCIYASSTKYEKTIVTSDDLCITVQYKATVVL